MVKQFLLSHGKDSLLEVGPEELLSYRLWVSQAASLSKGYGGAALEQCLRLFPSKTREKLCPQMEKTSLPRAIHNKTFAFLVSCKIQNLEEITYETRKSYEAYLQGSKCKKTQEYLKGLDLLKLSSVKEGSHPCLSLPIPYQPKPLYLGYFPEIKVAMEFYYVRNKDELLFDFSLPAPESMKKQIFETLKEILKHDYNRKERRERHLVPLKTLYLFCVKRQVADLLRMEAEEWEAYQRSLADKPVNERKACLQILERTCRSLFLHAKETDWGANIWFLERFSLNERNHPASMVDSLRFLQVKNPEDRKCLQEYMRYCIGLGSRTLHTVRLEHYNLLQFLEFCHLIGKGAAHLYPEDLERYLNGLEGTVQGEAYNKKLRTLQHFYYFLTAKGYLPQPPLWLEYYKKKLLPLHHNRSVPKEIQREILLSLKEFPEHLRLMYLHLWCLGLRCSEVCCLKGDAYFLLGEDTWIRVFQHKTGTEKTIPVPRNLYLLMRHYIEKNRIQPEEYIFKNHKGGAYNAQTLCIQVSRLCRKLNIGSGTYHFRSHDFRHTAATALYEHNSSIQAVRDYLGHQKEDMTKAYIDYLPEKLDAASEIYFQAGSLGAKLMKKKEKEYYGTIQDGIRGKDPDHGA